MAKNSIELSKKHGVNPSLDVCPICEKSRGVVLFGRMKDDSEAPRSVVVSIPPCDECKTHIGDGVVCYRSIDREPTGEVIVISKEAFTGVFGNATEHGIAIVVANVFDNLFKNIEFKKAPTWT